jgi:hypothetical protein
VSDRFGPSVQSCEGSEHFPSNVIRFTAEHLFTKCFNSELIKHSNEHLETNKFVDSSQFSLSSAVRPSAVFENSVSLDDSLGLRLSERIGWSSELMNSQFPYVSKLLKKSEFLTKSLTVRETEHFEDSVAFDESSSMKSKKFDWSSKLKHSQFHNISKLFRKSQNLTKSFVVAETRPLRHSIVFDKSFTMKSNVFAGSKFTSTELSESGHQQLTLNFVSSTKFAGTEYLDHSSTTESRSTSTETLILTTAFSILAFLIVVGFVIFVLLKRRREETSRSTSKTREHETDDLDVESEFGFGSSDGIVPLDANGEWATQTGDIESEKLWFTEDEEIF